MDRRTSHRVIKAVSYCTVIIIIAAGIFSLVTLRDKEGKIHFIQRTTSAKPFVRRTFLSPDTMSPFTHLGKEVNINSRIIGRLSKTIFGFYPYWMNNYHHRLQYELLTHVAFFSYAVDPSTGAPSTIYQWLSTDLVEEAKSKGTKVVLAATCFGAEQNRSLLSNTSIRRTLIDSLVSLIRLRNADGVNIDFEIVPSELRDSLSTFMRELSVSLRQTVPNSHLSIDIPARDRDDSFDIPILNQICDHIIIMGYDYYYGGSGIAGPVAPLTSDGTWRKEHIISTIEDYIEKGASPEKLLLGVPFYGYEWFTEADTAGSRTIQNAKPRYYASIRADSIFDYRKTDEHSKTKWIAFKKDNRWKQIWFDDSASLASKYYHVDTTGLGGIAIWALGFDGGRKEIWDGIVDAFVRVEKIDFNRLFPLPSNIIDAGGRGISSLSQIKRTLITKENYCLRLNLRDSMYSTRSWFIPIDLHDIMVLPRTGILSLRLRCEKIPLKTYMYCEYVHRGKIYRTFSQPIFSNKRWIEFRFAINPYVDSTLISENENVKLSYVTLHRLCIEAPGNDHALDLEIDDITSKVMTISPSSFVRTAIRKENIFTIDCSIDGKEVHSYSLQIYNSTKKKWEDRIHQQLRRNEIFDGTISDTLRELGTHYYRLIVFNMKRQILEMNYWSIEYKPSLPSQQLVLSGDALKISITIPEQDFYTISVFNVEGIKIDSMQKLYLKAGEHDVALTHRHKLVRLKNGVYYVRIESPNYRTTERALLLKLK